MKATTLTTGQEAEMRRLKQYFPYRIVWAEIDKAGIFNAYTSTDKRQLNKSLRAGNIVAMI